jgi:hypothetical protein
MATNKARRGLLVTYFFDVFWQHLMAIARFAREGIDHRDKIYGRVAQGECLCAVGQHDRAIYWLSRAVDILDAGPPKPSRLKHIDAGYMFAALFFLVLLWII